MGRGRGAELEWEPGARWRVGDREGGGAPVRVEELDDGLVPVLQQGDELLLHGGEAGQLVPEAARHASSSRLATHRGAHRGR